MKKLSKLVLGLSLGLAAVTSAFAGTKYVVAANPTPGGEILEFIKPYLKEKGIDLEIKVFNDFVLPNLVVAEGKADANFYQHRPYLDKFNAERGTNLVAGFEVLLAPFGIYSKKYKSISEVQKGDVVAVPNDPANEGRAFLLLEQVGLIKLKDSKDLYANPRTVAENPYKLKFKEVEAANLPRVIQDVAFDTINANYAMRSGLHPQKDALALELGSPYGNVIVTRPELVNSREFKLLAEALNRQAVYDFILEKYKGGILPTFTPPDAPKKAEGETKAEEKTEEKK